MLANVNAFGAPVATARYMGGREYEAIAQSGDEPTVDAVIEVLSLGAIALPSFASAGPFSGRRGRLEGVDALHGTQRAALATLYSALMTAVLIESLGAAGEIFVDGPLARNPLFARLLAACVPVGTVRTYPEGGGTRVAAHLAGLPSPAAGRAAIRGAAAPAGAARIPGQLAPPARREIACAALPANCLSGQFHHVGVHVAVHVRAEDEPLAVAREDDVRLQAVVVLLHVDQPLGAQRSGMHEVAGIRRRDSRHVRDRLRREQVQPLAVFRVGHHFLVAAVAGELLAVRRDLEVHRPMVAIDVVPAARAIRRGRASQNTSPRGVCRSYQMVLPSTSKNSWPAISMFMVRR